MIKFIRIFKERESREDRLRRMWTRIYETESIKQQEQEDNEIEQE